MDPSPSHTAQPSASAAKENRRSQGAASGPFPSFLLLASTIIAALFCYLYITKPVVINLPPPTHTTTLTPPPTPAPQSKTTSQAANTSSAPAAAKAPTHASLEETNIRIQHILTAETAGGRSDRIELTVPVLYRSRYLRWSDQELQTARQLMEKLVRYQEQSRALREEGHALLTAWNQLVDRSLPTEALRADSPSLPSNQKDAHETPRPAGWKSTELIQIQTPEK